MTEDGDAKIVAEKPKSAKRRLNKRVFVIILVVLVLAIVGLVIAIVVNMNTQNDIGEGGSSDDSGIVVDDYDPNQAIVDEIQNEIAGMSEEDAQAYLDDKIEEYTDTDLAFDVKLVKIYYLFNAGQSEIALEVAKEINTEDLNNQELLSYYAAMRTIYQGLDDIVWINYYQDLYLQLYLEIFDGGAGGE